MSNRQDDQILEVVFHSATDLPKPPLSFKAANPYVMADIVNPDSKPNWIKTITHEKGGENPIWDYVIPFPLNHQKLHTPRNFIFFVKIMHSGTALGDREIGHIKMRLSDLLAGASAGENITYPVVAVSSGEERGKIVISHKLLTTSTIGNHPPMEFLNTTHVPHFLPQNHNTILELVFHCAIDLPHPLFNSKGRPYVLAAIVCNNTKTDWVKTVTDEKGGKNPVWDYVIQFPMNQKKVRMARNFNLICKIMHFGNNLGDREIGHVKVRLQDFLAGDATGENISYPVVVSGGVEKGKIVISHKLVTNTASPSMGDDEDQNHGDVRNAGGGMKCGIKIAATATTVGAAIYGVVAELT